MPVSGPTGPPGGREELVGCTCAAPEHRPQHRAGAAPPGQGLRIRAAAQLRACSNEPRLTAVWAQILERDTGASRAAASTLAVPGCPTERLRLEVGCLTRHTVRLRSRRSTRFYDRCSSRHGVPTTGEGGTFAVFECGRLEAPDQSSLLSSVTLKSSPHLIAPGTRMSMNLKISEKNPGFSVLEP
ncbi:hypothetical protein NDU88_001114 [Pleurodeles waltl]|uniref:Uncharacterized protein n=1 Tax=Pleurodeles waltl TaxID=8319 RepID=A0AAV7THN5_PLEWA|nr:hypothetical protein NDU88_001114 [Pleurodeles waltl]